jgi:heat shock protein HslJ
MNQIIKTTLLLTCLTVGLSSITSNPVMANEIPGQNLIAQNHGLTGKTWKLVRWGDHNNLKTPLASSEINAEFADGRISGTGGCNRYNAGYTIDGNRINFGPAASTKMACAEDVMDQEMVFLTALNGAKTYRINPQGQLEIEYETDQGSGVMIFATNTVRALW